MPFWARQIGDGDAARLFVMQVNLRFGCVILRHYLDVEKGDLFMALGRYNGSRGQAAYPNMVLGARKRWEWADPRAGGGVAGPASRRRRVRPAALRAVGSSAAGSHPGRCRCPERVRARSSAAARARTPSISMTRSTVSSTISAIVCGLL